LGAVISQVCWTGATPTDCDDDSPDEIGAKPNANVDTAEIATNINSFSMTLPRTSYEVWWDGS
jgi:hypothetical protein